MASDTASALLEASLSSTLSPISRTGHFDQPTDGEALRLEHEVAGSTISNCAKMTMQNNVLGIIAPSTKLR